MCLHQTLHFIVDFYLDLQIVEHESSMYLTAFACGILDLFYAEIFKPVIDVPRAAARDDDHVFHFLVTDKA